MTERRLAASSEQYEIWLAVQREPESGRYNIPLDLEFEVPPDASAVRSALTALLHRHDGLRSRFDAEGDELARIVVPEPELAFVEHVFEEPYRRESALAHAAAAGWRPFDLSTAPLLRGELFSYPDGAVLVLTVHHIVSDGWSQNILLNDFLDCYRAVCERQPDSSTTIIGPSSPASPAVLVEEAEESDAAMHYWRDVLQGAGSALAPVTDLVRDGADTAVSACVHRPVPDELRDRVRALAQAEDTTAAQVLLAVYAVLLHAWDGADEGTFGMLVADRPTLESQTEIAMRAKTLPLLSHLKWQEPFRDVLTRLGDKVLDCLDHAAVTSRQLRVARLEAGLDSTQDTSVFLHFPVREGQWTVAGSTVRTVDHDVAAGKYDFALAVFETHDRMDVQVDYDTSLYRRATAELFLEQFLGLLTAVTLRPEVACGELISTCHGRPAGSPASTPVRTAGLELVDELVAEQAVRRPGAVAVRHGDVTLTYQELVSRAAGVAEHLGATGIGRGDVVATLLPAGVDAITVWLAALFAGAAYLPLDTAYPDAQLQFALDDTDPRLLVVTPEAMGRLRFPDERTVSAGDLVASGRATGRTSPPRTDGRSADEPVNILYTSGSTGRPKGVLLPHRGLARLLAQPDFLPIDATDVFTQLSPLNFDGATYEVWGSLAHGAELVVLDKDLVLDPQRLRAAVRRHGVTTLLVTTPLLNRIIEDAPDTLQSLRRVYFGGEIISVPHIRKALRWSRPGTLVHSYGPTENSFTSTRYTISEVGDDVRTLPIGSPVPGTTAHVVLSGTLLPAPRCVPGELVLGGAGVALGYVGDPALGEGRFVPDPFSAEPGSLLYRTGDRVRWTADGQLEFIGRTDNQVKIRSQRVELGEVEAALLAHPAVRSCFATARINSRSEKEIVAYVVLEPGRHLESVRSHLRSALPQFAVPSHLIPVDALPLTANGKIDRRRLPEPVSPGTVDTGAPQPAPRPSVPAGGHAAAGGRRGVSAAWAEVLGHAAFGPDDNFFDAGGHSLLLVRLRDAIRRETGASLSILDLMRNTTVAAQSRLVDPNTPVRPPRAEPSRRPVHRDEPIAVIGMAGRFAQAPDLDAFWKNLASGRDCFTTGERIVVAELDGGRRQVARWGMLGGGLGYDAGLLGFSTEDLRHGDPQQGILHEVLWSAVEDAALRLSDISRRTALYAGCSRVIQTPGDVRVDDIVNADPTFVASRFAYRHDLWGEALLVDTACSTSLYTVHLAGRSLLSGDCDYALAAGVSVDGSSDGTYLYRPGMLFSQDGYCRPFDRDASGTVGGFGAGAVLLRRLSDAVRDGDPIYAVLPGSAVNNDGRARVGYSAPGVEGQARVIRDALRVAGVTPEEVGFVEAHGTGTRLGDAIEATALSDVFAGCADGRVAVGSVKASIGHCNAAAGVAGLIKTVLAVHHGYLPRTPHVADPIDELSGSFRLLTEGREWTEPGRPRTAGVSAFGVGGTNAHIVVQQFDGAAVTKHQEG